jgi:YD repeat-containing protein
VRAGRRDRRATVTPRTTSYGHAPGITYPLPAAATWAASDTLTYGYDNAGDLNSVTDFNGHQLSISRTADSLPSTETLGSTGDTLTTNYDSSDSVSAIALMNGGTTAQSFSYSDAPDGDALTETDTPSSSQSPASYTYDSQGRVISMTPGTGTAHSYGFDASSDLTTLPTGAAATYDHDSELTSSALGGTTTSYTYNADGQRLTHEPGRLHRYLGNLERRRKAHRIQRRSGEHERGDLRRQRPAGLGHHDSGRRVGDHAEIRLGR